MFNFARQGHFDGPSFALSCGPIVRFIGARNMKLKLRVQLREGELLFLYIVQVVPNSFFLLLTALGDLKQLWVETCWNIALIPILMHCAKFTFCGQLGFAHQISQCSMVTQFLQDITFSTIDHVHDYKNLFTAIIR